MFERLGKVRNKNIFVLITKIDVLFAVCTQKMTNTYFDFLLNLNLKFEMNHKDYMKLNQITRSCRVDFKFLSYKIILTRFYFQVNKLTRKVSDSLHRRKFKY